MGISRFYRWISERYPQINEDILDVELPPFDNLYLDVNGIAHNSVNSKDMSTPNLGLELTEKGSPEIWASIFKYINKLVRIVKPKKLVYIAIDGVAPRAKMNQQRSRRFRSARDAEILKNMEEKNLVNTKNKNNFDSNCITPGTTFMYELKRQLKFFICYQIQNDVIWKDLQIILSGADVPGEGEHKIMDYIRCTKSQPDYNPNTRHCLYGLDADLIMLSLASHEPHFSLLREEVKFFNSKNLESRSILTKDKFQFLHISLLREYIINDLDPRSLSNEELRECAEQCKPNGVFYANEINFSDQNSYNRLFKSNFIINNERLIDDFIILGFIVGNDFLPHIPFHTVDQGFARIMNSYKKYLAQFFIQGIKRTPWLLEDCGRINFENFLHFLVWHMKSERDESEKRLINPNYWRSVIPDSNKKFSDSLGIPKFMKSDSLEEDKLRMQWQFKQPENFDIMRWRYYYVKMKINLKKFLSLDFDSSLQLGVDDDEVDLDEINSNSIEDIVFCYLEGLQWVSYYYFRGVPSWRWYYPYRYAPFACDIVVILTHWIQTGRVSTISRDDIVKVRSSKFMFIDSMYSTEMNLNKIAFRFVRGTPLQPFEQLMAVLPSKSKELLPKPFRRLFTSPNSPLIKYYPSDFEVDMEGVKVPWGGVTLIPFIDEPLLIQSITYVLSKEGCSDLDFSKFKFKNSSSDNISNRETRYIFLFGNGKFPELINDFKFVDSSNINSSECLTKEDLERNSIGKPLIFYYDFSSNSNLQIESTIPTYLSSVVNSKVTSAIFLHPTLPKNMSHFPNDLLENTIIPQFGFPCFGRIPFKMFYNSGVRVFGSESNNESLFTSISSDHITMNFLLRLMNFSRKSSKSLKQKLIVGYPKAIIAELVSVKTPRYIYKPTLFSKPIMTVNNNPEDVIRILSNEHAFLKRRGIIIEKSNYEIDVDEILKSISSHSMQKIIRSNCESKDESRSISTPENCLVEVRISEYSYLNEQREIVNKFSNNSKHFLLPLVALFSDNSYSMLENNSEFKHIDKGERILCIDRNSEYYGNIGIVSGKAKNIIEDSVVFQIPKNRIKIEQLQKKALEYALEDLCSIQWFSFEDATKILFKPLINCLKETGGLDDSKSLKYMKYSSIVINKIIMGPIQVKSNDNNLHEISMMLYSEDKQQKTKHYLPSFSKFADKNPFETSLKSLVSLGTPVISNEAIKSLIEYIGLFPNFVFSIFNYLINFVALKQFPNTGNDHNDKESNFSENSKLNLIEEDLSFTPGQIVICDNWKIHVREIFPDIEEPKDQDFKFNLSMDILKKKIYRNLRYVNQNSKSISMSPSTISRLEKLIQNSKLESSRKKINLDKFSVNRNFFLSEFCTNSWILNKSISKNGFPLGTRIVYIRGINGIVPFGTIGTVISTYNGVKMNKEASSYALLDILLDMTHINASNLNGKCSNLRGITVSAFECIPLLSYMYQKLKEDHLYAIKDSLLHIERSLNNLNSGKMGLRNNRMVGRSKDEYLQSNLKCDSVKEISTPRKNKTLKGRQNTETNSVTGEIDRDSKHKKKYFSSFSNEFSFIKEVNSELNGRLFKNKREEFKLKHKDSFKQKGDKEAEDDTKNEHEVAELMELEIKKLLKIS